VLPRDNIFTRTILNGEESKFATVCGQISTRIRKYFGEIIKVQRPLIYEKNSGLNLARQLSNLFLKVVLTSV
jgi:hypothetical protein